VQEKKSKDYAEHCDLGFYPVRDDCRTFASASLFRGINTSSGQCPGHYDVKLSDIEKAKKADLIVTFGECLFWTKMSWVARSQLLVDAGDRNWMAPNSYIYGLGHLAGELSKRFPKEKNENYET